MSRQAGSSLSSAHFSIPPNMLCSPTSRHSHPASHHNHHHNKLTFTHLLQVEEEVHGAALLKLCVVRVLGGLPEAVHHLGGAVPRRSLHLRVDGGRVVAAHLHVTHTARPGTPAGRQGGERRVAWAGQVGAERQQGASRRLVGEARGGHTCRTSGRPAGTLLAPTHNNCLLLTSLLDKHTD